MHVRCPVCDALNPAPRPTRPGERLARIRCVECNVSFEARTSSWSASKAFSAPATQSAPGAFFPPPSQNNRDPFKPKATSHQDNAPGDDLLPGDGQFFDPNRPEPEPIALAPDPPTLTPKRPTRPRVHDEAWIANATRDIPTSGNFQPSGNAKMLPADPVFAPQRTHTPLAEPHKPRRGAALFVMLVIGAAIIAGLWWTSGPMVDLWTLQAKDYLKEATGDLLDDFQDDTAADTPPPPTGPKVMGEYVERIHTRPDGSKVRVWSRREDNPGVGAPAPSPRQGNKATPKASAPKSSGAVVQNFVMRDHDGKPVELHKLRGKVVVLNFYANWCPPCRQEIPDFSRLYRETRQGDKIRFYGVLLQSGPFSIALKKTRELGVVYPVLAGTPVVGSKYDIKAFPTTIIVDPQGREYARVRGAVSYDRLRKLVNEARAAR